VTYRKSITRIYLNQGEERKKRDIIINQLCLSFCSSSPEKALGVKESEKHFNKMGLGKHSINGV